MAGQESQEGHLYKSESAHNEPGLGIPAAPWYPQEWTTSSFRRYLGNYLRNQQPHESKVYGANMGPIWGRQDPGGHHVGPMNFVICDGLNAIRDQGL